MSIKVKNKKILMPSFIKQKIKPHSYLVTVPKYRLDVENKEDLVEEIIKIYGYNNIPSSLPSWLPKELVIDKKQNWRELIQQILNISGYQEIVTYSLVSEEEKDEFCLKSKSAFYYLLVPKSKFHVFYRQSVLPSHLKVIAYNLNHQNEDLFFFEISKTHSRTSQGLKEEEILTLSATGKMFTSIPVHHLEQKYDFFWLKGTIENIFHSLNIVNKIDFVLSRSKEFHPYQSADILLAENKVSNTANQGEKIGFVGQIHPSLTKKYQIDFPVFTAQISLSKLFDSLTEENLSHYQPVSIFPKIEQDVSFVLNQFIEVGKIVETIRKAGGNFLTEVKVYDVYQSKEFIDKEKKSITFRLIFQSSEKTLLSKEVNEIIKKIVNQIKNSFGAELRS